MNETYHHIGEGGRRYWGDKGAGILFTDGKSVLLLKRAQFGSADNVGTWGIPGGKAEKGESAIDTAVRETKEEAGNVEGTRFAQFDEKDGRHIFTVFLYKVSKPFEVKLSEEHNASEWINLADLNEYNLHPKFEQGLPYYLRAIHRKFKQQTPAP
jgi:ADP-ribose pyrophosphatase YjhB (NUDIX family)